MIEPNKMFDGFIKEGEYKGAIISKPLLGDEVKLFKKSFFGKVTEFVLDKNTVVQLELVVQRKVNVDAKITFKNGSTSVAMLDTKMFDLLAEKLK